MVRLKDTAAIAILITGREKRYSFSQSSGYEKWKYS